jgi:hypothetical protein
VNNVGRPSLGGEGPRRFYVIFRVTPVELVRGRMGRDDGRERVGVLILSVARAAV